MDSSLFDRTVIVTGASSGLGEATARVAARAGAHVVLAARRKDRLEGLAHALTAEGASVTPVVTDVSDHDQCVALVERAVATTGSVHGLVNCAGVGTAEPATRETPEAFEAVQRVNLFGTYWCSQAFARVAPPGSAIVNVASIIGLTSVQVPQAAYSSSKAGVLGLTRDLAMQWGARKGIRVNAVAPGIVPTEMSDEYPDEVREAVRARTALGRFGEPNEIAEPIVFLLSAGATYITGTTLAIDGGLTLH